MGCSPNVHGAVITLCNCKLYMRAAEYFHDPRGVWVAGVTIAGLTSKHRRYLFYLMFAQPVWLAGSLLRPQPKVSVA
jgi:hypothetical protein